MNKTTPEFGPCMDCGSRKVRTIIHQHIFSYGLEGEPPRLELPAAIPVRLCMACGAEWCDHEAEAIETAAIEAHIAGEDVAL